MKIGFGFTYVEKCVEKWLSLKMLNPFPVSQS